MKTSDLLSEFFFFLFNDIVRNGDLLKDKTFILRFITSLDMYQYVTKQTGFIWWDTVFIKEFYRS
jgi:hypothetical protein